MIVKDTSELLPIVQQKLQALLADLSAAHLHMRIVETYRSDERQAQLYAEGKSKIKKAGKHGQRRAIDFCIDVKAFAADNEAKYKPQSAYDTSASGLPVWFDFGELAERHGFRWGGRFCSVSQRRLLRLPDGVDLPPQRVHIGWDAAHIEYNKND